MLDVLFMGLVLVPGFLYSITFGSNFSDMEKKRGTLKGFDGGVETMKRIKNWEKNKVLGNWRKTDKIKVEYTILTKSWTWRGDDDQDPYTEKHIAPWGMVNEATASLLSDNVGNSYKNLPNDVKNHYPSLQISNFNKKDIVITVTNSGNMGYDTLYYIYCNVCKAKFLLPFLNEFRDMLPNQPTVEDVLANWDKIKEKKKFTKSQYNSLLIWQYSIKTTCQPNKT